MRPRRLSAIVCAIAVSFTSAPVASASPLVGSTASATGSPTESRVLVTTPKGRQLIARRYGNPAGPTTLVVAAIHGSEGGGVAVARRIAALATTTTANLWVIEVANPDGLAAKTRQNARKVDLNRNFPSNDWARIPAGRNYSGPKAASEPETQALVAFISEIRPQLSIWYHQVGPIVDLHPMAQARLVRRYAKLVGYEARTVPCAGGCTGNVTTWTMQTIPGATAFVVELPKVVSVGTRDRHARAALSVFASL